MKAEEVDGVRDVRLRGVFHPCLYETLKRHRSAIHASLVTFLFCLFNFGLIAIKQDQLAHDACALWSGPSNSLPNVEAVLRTTLKKISMSHIRQLFDELM